MISFVGSENGQNYFQLNSLLFLQKHFISGVWIYRHSFRETLQKTKNTLPKIPKNKKHPKDLMKSPALEVCSPWKMSTFLTLLWVSQQPEIILDKHRPQHLTSRRASSQNDRLSYNAALPMLPCWNLRISRDADPTVSPGNHF